MEDTTGHETVRGLRETFRRFPLPLTCALLLTVTLLLYLHSNVRLFGSYTGRPSEWRVWLPVIIASLCACKLALLSHALYFERRPPSARRAVVAALLVLLAIPSLYILTDRPLLHSLFLMPGLVLLVMSAPFIGTKADDATYCHFNWWFFNAVTYGLVGGIILAAGLSCALAGIGYLFGMRLSGLYGDVWIIGMLLANYWILARMPRTGETGGGSAPYPKGTAFITTHILVPLILLYFVILYAYIGKIAVTGTLPRGNVAYMVMACGAVGVLAYFLAYPIRDGSTRWVRWFHRRFFLVLAGPLLLLWAGIVQRIHDYGVTEERYFVLCIAVWLSVISIHALWRRKRDQLQFIGLTAAGMLILASFGPWGAVGVSERSQSTRLQALLEQEGILKEGRILPPTSQRTLDGEAYRRVEDILRYLDRTGKLDVMATWFPQDSAIRHKLTAGRRYDVNSGMVMSELGILRHGWSNQGPSDTQFSFNVESPYETTKIMKVKGFDYVADIHAGQKEDRVLTLDEGDLRVHLGADDILRISGGKGRDVTFDLGALAAELATRYPATGNVRNRIRQDDAAVRLIGSSGDLTAYLQVRHLRGNRAWKEGRVTHYGGRLMLRYGPPLAAAEIQALTAEKAAGKPLP